MWSCFGMALTFYQDSFLWLGKMHSLYPSPTLLHSGLLPVELPAGKKKKKGMNSPCRTPDKMVYWFYAPWTPKHITMIDRIFKKEIQRVPPRLEQYQRSEQRWNHRLADLWSRLRWWQPRIGLPVKMEASTRLHATAWGGQPYFPHSQAKKARQKGHCPVTATMAFKG